MWGTFLDMQNMFKEVCMYFFNTTHIPRLHKHITKWAQQYYKILPPPPPTPKVHAPIRSNPGSATGKLFAKTDRVKTFLSNVNKSVGPSARLL